MVHYAIHGNDGLLSPYGRSMLRSAYQYYVQKQAMLQIALVAANYKSAPIPVFYVDPTVQIRDNAGNPMSLAQDVAQAVKGLRGNGFLVLNATKGTMVEQETIDNTADIEDFTVLLKYYDQQILHALLTPSSLFSIEEGGSYALGLTHSSAHGRIIKMFAEEIASVLLRDYVKDIIELNFAGDREMGRFDLLESSIDDKLKYGKLLEFGIKYNIINMDNLEDVNSCRYMLGLEPVDCPFVSPASDMGMGQVQQEADADAHGDDGVKASSGKKSGVSARSTKQATKKPYSKTGAS